MRKITFLFLLSFVLNRASSQAIEIKKDLVITSSINVIAKDYKIAADTSRNKAVLFIEGNNITIDFKKTVLTGSTGKTAPDEFYGTAIIIKNSKNVTIRNLSVRGYKIAVRVENTDGLHLENCDFSYNYRQHLNSTTEYEDISDWLSHHHNEKDEWLRYGAAIYMRNCNNSIISNCTITNGQNALMMTDCNNNIIKQNFFCFNSGLGIGMYCSSNNQIISNNLDWNVRGYSHGVYQRGQDSAGILLYEQSSNNLIQDNSVTHSGDGLFLWAGQTTMDNGQGGCNGNKIIHNDFSFAPTNGIEVTFSSNIIEENYIEGCTHGIWGGYSYNTTIEKNYFSNNRIAIAIEHGQQNKIKQNIFAFDSLADLADKAKTSSGIRLWSNPVEPSDWGYPKYRDTRSVHTSISENIFSGMDMPVDIKQTDSSEVISNISDKPFKKDSISNVVMNNEIKQKVTAYTFNKNTLLSAPKNSSRGRKYILVNEWGPYDFNSPQLVLRKQDGDVYEFEILGPKGTWSSHQLKNVVITETMQHNVPGVMKAVIKNKNDYSIGLSYKGEKIITQLGKVIPKGQAFLFSSAYQQQTASWNVSWFNTDSSLNPYTHYETYKKLIAGKPSATGTFEHIRFNWWGNPVKEVAEDYFATVAETDIKLEKGNYELGITSDDGVKIFVDGTLVIDAWNPALFQQADLPHFRKELQLNAGTHHIRIEHYELTGFSCLTFSLKKKA